jgi:hypothetical protein
MEDFTLQRDDVIFFLQSWLRENNIKKGIDQITWYDFQRPRIYYTIVLQFKYLESPVLHHTN